MGTHLKHKTKSKLTSVHLITSEKFNKSATLDIESNLIKYMSGDNKFTSAKRKSWTCQSQLLPKEGSILGYF